MVWNASGRLCFKLAFSFKNRIHITYFASYLQIEKKTIKKYPLKNRVVLICNENKSNKWLVDQFTSPRHRTDFIQMELQGYITLQAWTYGYNPCACSQTVFFDFRSHFDLHLSSVRPPLQWIGLATMMPINTVRLVPLQIVSKTCFRGGTVAEWLGRLLAFQQPLPRQPLSGYWTKIRTHSTHSS